MTENGTADSMIDEMVGFARTSVEEKPTYSVFKKKCNLAVWASHSKVKNRHKECILRATSGD